MFFKINLPDTNYHNIIGKLTEDKTPCIKAAVWSAQHDIFYIFRDKSNNLNFRSKIRQLLPLSIQNKQNSFYVKYIDGDKWSVGEIELSDTAWQPSLLYNGEAFKAFIVTCGSRKALLDNLINKLKEQSISYEVVNQPADWPISSQSATDNYFQAIKLAYSQNVSKTLILEDDVQIDNDFKDKLFGWPGLNGEIGFLYLPDIIYGIKFDINGDIAKPNRISGQFPHDCLWGSQAIVYNRNTLAKLIANWNDINLNHDGRILEICKATNTDMVYSYPCLVEHTAETILKTPRHQATTTWNENYTGSDFINKFLQQNKIIRPDLTGAECLRVILDALLKTKGVAGDVVEFGCNEGSTSVLISKLLEKDKQLYVYDSFEGLPEASQEDGNIKTKGACPSNQAKLVKNFKQNNIKFPIITKDWFCNLIDEQIPEQISFAFLDSDLYESIMDSLMIVLPRLSDGGIIAVHDCGHKLFPGVMKACQKMLPGFKCYNNIAVWQKPV